jgi:hypothetical protein
MQPRDCALDDPASLAQTAAVLGSAPSNLRTDSLSPQGSAMRLRVVGTIGLNEFGFALGATALATNGRDRPNQGQQLGDVVAVGLGQDDRQRNTLRIRKDVVFRTGTTAIGWVRSRFFPAPRARMEELSATAREKSIRSAPRSLDSSPWCSRSHTLARCQALSRRQQVLPEPQPISWGSICQGMPERSTKMIPVSAARLSISGRRPGFFLRRRLGAGRSGSIIFHNSSSISGLGIAPLE